MYVCLLFINDVHMGFESNFLDENHSDQIPQDEAEERLKSIASALGAVTKRYNEIKDLPEFDQDHDELNSLLARQDSLEAEKEDIKSRTV